MQNNPIWAPSWKGLIGVAATFLAGVLISSALSVFLIRAGLDQQQSMLLSYPVMFLPVIVLAILKSRTTQVAVKSHVSRSLKVTDWPLILLVALLTFSAAFLSEAINNCLPEMPDYLKEALSVATGGNFLLNFLCVALMAPVLEEFLCRGLVLRGIVRNGGSPSVAILVSALFFALIHGNLWQAIPAFLLGVLFGYVYYKTDCLWLSVIMHFTNNCTSLVISRIEGIAEDATWMSVMPIGCYWVLFVFFAIALVLGIREISSLHVVNSKNVSSVF